jgi:hypothetical protein
LMATKWSAAATWACYWANGASAPNKLLSFLPIKLLPFLPDHFVARN